MTRHINAHHPPDLRSVNARPMMAARWGAGLSRTDAAGRLGVEVETYIGWESGTAVPPRRDRPALAAVLGVRLVDLDGWLEPGRDDLYRIGRPR